LQLDCSAVPARVTAIALQFPLRHSPMMDEREIPATSNEDVSWDLVFERIVRDNVPLLTDDVPLIPETRLSDFGLDSLNMLGLMIAVEAEYGIEVPSELLTFRTFTTPRALWTAVRRLRPGSARTEDS
jgi:acyl carrier protein